MAVAVTNSEPGMTEAESTATAGDGLSLTKFCPKVDLDSMIQDDVVFWLFMSFFDHRHLDAYNRIE
jgi:hypothetical protein